jgi:hypothetical protein
VPWKRVEKKYNILKPHFKLARSLYICNNDTVSLATIALHHPPSSLSHFTSLHLTSPTSPAHHTTHLPFLIPSPTPIPTTHHLPAHHASPKARPSQLSGTAAMCGYILSSFPTTTRGSQAQRSASGTESMTEATWLPQPHQEAFSVVVGSE